MNTPEPIAPGAAGLVTILPVFLLSLVAGAFADAISTNVRNTIRQIETPDHLRGRMTSVHKIFFMGGPQLGELEAGFVGPGFGAPVAVASGGIGCLIALGAITPRFPELRRYGGVEPASHDEGTTNLS